MAEPYRTSALEHRKPLEAEGAVVQLSEAPYATKHILRGEARNLAEAVLHSADLELPRNSGTSAGDEKLAALWLAPDEWLLVGLDRQAGPLAGKLSGVAHQLVDVSDYYTILEVAGPRARKAVQKLSTLDLHAREFPVGSVAGTILGHASVWLWSDPDRHSDTDVFKVFVRWSHADYLWCLLANACKQWGMDQDQPVSGEKLLTKSAQSL